MQLSSPVSISFFCVFRSNIGFSLFSSDQKLPLCFSLEIQSNLLLQCRHCQFLHEGYVAVLIAICVRALTDICFSFRVCQVFSFFISIRRKLRFFNFSITFSSSLLWVFFVFSFRLNDETKHFALRRLYHSFVVFCEGPRS